MQSYDDEKPSKYIMDVNDLYGWEMNQYLPYC